MERIDKDRVLTAGAVVKHVERECGNIITESFLYKVIGVAFDTKHGGKVIVLQSLENTDVFFTLPLTDFLKEVDKETYPNCKQKYEYELV